MTDVISASEGTPASISLESLDRIPGFGSSFGYAKQLYSYGKSTSAAIPLVPGLIDAAEQRFTDAISPLIEKHRETIQSVDKVAVEKIDNIEKMVAGTKDSIHNKIGSTSSTLKDSLRSKIDSTTAVLQENFETLQENSTVQYGVSLATAIEATVTSPLKRSAAIAEGVIDVVLNDEGCIENDWATAISKIRKITSAEESSNSVDTDGDDSTETTVALPGRELRATIAQYRQLASKAHSRSAKLAMLKLKDAQLRASDTVSSIQKNTVNLIEYAKIEIDSNVNAGCDAVRAKLPLSVDEAVSSAISKVKQVRPKVAGLPKLAAETATANREKARAAAIAAIKYIIAQRELVEISLASSSAAVREKVMTRVLPIGDFLQQQFQESGNWDKFSARMDSLLQQANAILHEVKNAERDTLLSVLSEQSSKLYGKFESVTDSRLLYILELIRYYTSTANAQSSPDEAKGADDVVVPNPESDAERNMVNTSVGAEVEAEAEAELPEFHDSVDEGLVLKVKPHSPPRNFTPMSPGFSDIDDEAALLRVPRI